MQTKEEIDSILQNLTGVLELSLLVGSFSEEDKKVIFSKFMASAEIPDKIVNDIFDLQVLTKLFPDEKELIFDKFIASAQRVDKFTADFMEFEILFELFPKKEETIFNIFKQKYPNTTTLSPTLFVPEQVEPNCGLNALSSITKFISEKENNPSAYFPIKSEESGKSLKKLGKLHGIKGPGAIFSFKKFQSLVEETGESPKVLYIDKEDKFSDTIKNLINLHIPVIVPYDIKNEGGTWAHYGVITGFIEEGDRLTFTVSHNNKISFFDKHDLFLNTSNLKEFGGAKFVKKTESSFYGEVSSELETGYKEHIYPRINLENTLRNRLLIVCSESMKNELETSDFYRDIEKFVENNPQEEVELGEPNWDLLYPKEPTEEVELGEPNWEQEPIADILSEPSEDLSSSGRYESIHHIKQRKVQESKDTSSLEQPEQKSSGPSLVVFK